MSRTDMTIEEFEDLLFAHGADPAGWPDADRARAETCLADMPAAQKALQEARRLEAALVSARPADPTPSDALLRRILADAATVRPLADLSASGAEAPSPSSASILDRLRDFLSPAAACAASAALGLWLGYAGPVDVTGMAADALGVEIETEFALLDSAVASPMAGLIEELEIEE